MTTRVTRAFTLILLASVQLTGCAYYNTFFHAEKYYDQAVDQEKKQSKKSSTGTTRSQGRATQGKVHELYSKCIQKCKKLAERFPTSKWRDDASLLMAKAYYGKKDYLSAKGELLRFMGRYPSSELLPSAQYYLGLAYYQSGNQKDARETWAALSAQFPKAEENQEVSYFLAQSYESEGDLEEAAEAYETYIRSQNRSVEAFDARLDRASMWLQAGETGKAREDLLVVSEKGRNKFQRLDANLLLAQTLEAEDELQKALDLYWELAYMLDPHYMSGRIPAEDRKRREEELVAKAEEERVSVAILKEKKDYGRKMLKTNSLEYENLARVMMSEGQILAKLGRLDDAVTAYQQVIAEYPKSRYSSEAQYRIGYSYEVYAEDLEAAEQAYRLVSHQGRSSFSEDAVKRATSLSRVKNLATAPKDSSAQFNAEMAKGRFLKAELFLFQQNRPEKAIEEYESIQRDFSGTDYEGKAALAEAYVRFYVQKDQARGRAALGEVMRKFKDTEFGVYARRILKGPDPEPELTAFAGPPLDLLLTDENLVAVTGRDSSVLAAGKEENDREISFTTGDLFRAQANGAPGADGPDVDPASGSIPGASRRALNLGAVPAGGSSPILSAWEREPRTARNRISKGFPFSFVQPSRSPAGKSNDDKEKPKPEAQPGENPKPGAQPGAKPKPQENEADASRKESDEP